MSSDKKLVIPESMVARMMELAGNKALFKRSILTEEKSEDSSSEKKKSSDDSESSSEKKKESPPKEDKSSEGKSSSFGNSSSEETESEGGDYDEEDTSEVGISDDILDPDLTSVDDDTQSLDADQFVDALVDLVSRHFGKEIVISGGDTVEDEFSDIEEDDLSEEPGLEGEESMLGGEDDLSAVTPDDSLGVEEDSVPTAPPKPPSSMSSMGMDKRLPESKKISPIAKQIYNNLMKALVKKEGINLQEAKKQGKEVSVKLTEKKTTVQKKPLNEGTNPKTGQPHVKAPYLDKTVKGKPGKPAKESPAPPSKPEPVKPKKC